MLPNFNCSIHISLDRSEQQRQKYQQGRETKEDVVRGRGRKEKESGEDERLEQTGRE